MLLLLLLLLLLLTLQFLYIIKSVQCFSTKSYAFTKTLGENLDFLNLYSVNAATVLALSLETMYNEMRNETPLQL